MTDKELARQIAGEIVDAHSEPVLPFTLERGEPGVFESKVGGLPYLPHDMAWPLDNRGMGMELLAQVDCGALASLPDFPHTGLLQFFHALDDVYGVDFDDMVCQLGFRVLYHETVDPTVTAEEVLAKKAPQPEEDRDFYTPILTPCRMIFSDPAVQHINENDYRGWKEFLQRWNQLHGTAFKDRWEYYQATKISREFPASKDNGPHHQLGGYPFFTQYDPRGEDVDYDRFDTLLFQLDSDGRGPDDLVLWGDCGVGNFFINREDLKRRDFSQVLYNWDCC